MVNDRLIKDGYCRICKMYGIPTDLMMLTDVCDECFGEFQESIGNYYDPDTGW